MSGFIRRYFIDVSSLPDDAQEEVFKKLQGSCWTVSLTDSAGIYDVFWETKRGDVAKLPFLPTGCTITPLD